MDEEQQIIVDSNDATELDTKGNENLSNKNDDTVSEKKQRRAGKKNTNWSEFIEDRDKRKRRFDNFVNGIKSKYPKMQTIIGLKYFFIGSYDELNSYAITSIDQNKINQKKYNIDGKELTVCEFLSDIIHEIKREDQPQDIINEESSNISMDSVTNNDNNEKGQTEKIVIPNSGAVQKQRKKYRKHQKEFKSVESDIINDSDYLKLKDAMNDQMDLKNVFFSDNNTNNNKNENDFRVKISEDTLKRNADNESQKIMYSSFVQYHKRKNINAGLRERRKNNKEREKEIALENERKEKKRQKKLKTTKTKAIDVTNSNINMFSGIPEGQYRQLESLTTVNSVRNAILDKNDNNF